MAGNQQGQGKDTAVRAADEGRMPIDGPAVLFLPISISECCEYAGENIMASNWLG